MEIVQAVKKLNSILQAPLNFRRRPFCVQLCKETLYKWATSVAHLTNFSFEFFKARAWWPWNRSSTKIFFWRFVFLWVNLALLNPIKIFSWRGCVVQATKNKEESCSLLDAIGRRSCGPLSGLAKIDMWENPSFDSSGSRQLVGTLRCALSLSSHLRFNSRSSLACLLLCMHIVGHVTELLKAKFTPAVVASGKFCSISPPPPPPLSLSPHVSRFENNNHFR